MPINNPQLEQLLKKQLGNEETITTETTATVEEVQEIREAETKNSTSIELPSLKKQENRKAYPFTLKPSVRKKITKLANDNGYKSASAFVNDVFEGM